MSLATRCTHCDTIFKVVQDQLKVSEGWVRCGRCHQVFNALEGLFDMDREPPPQRGRGAAAATKPPPAVPDAPDTVTPPEPNAWQNTLPSPPPAQLGPHDAAAALSALPPPPEREAVTHFELDLPPGDPMPFGEAATLPSPPSPRPSPPLPPLPPLPRGLPSTDESDALDSRYLLTSEQAQRPRRRRSRGPDFADAQFPADVADDPGLADSDWLHSEPGGPGASTRPVELPTAPTVPNVPPGPVAAPDTPPALGRLFNTASPEADTQPAPAPSRFEHIYQPEQTLPPPSQRKGKPGTRGRVPAPPPPAFIQQAERRAIWRHPVVRGVLGIFALLLTGLLAGQAAHHWRDQLASRYPELRPGLAQWCALAGCQIQPPMALDDLQVDNITLVKTDSEGSDTYRMTLIIHSRANVPVAWPQVDITLTNPSGELLSRRVFNTRTARVVTPAPGVPPGEAAPAPTSMPVPPAVPPGASTTLQWQLRAPDLHLTSYTAELFYP